MANNIPISVPFKAISLLFLALTITCASSSRILDEEALITPAVAPEASDPVGTPVSGVTPLAAPQESEPVETPVPNATPVAAPEASDPVETPVSNVTPVATAPAAATSSTVANTDLHHPLSFFMHDILGGSNPSAGAVTGIVSNPAVNGQVPFAMPNGAVPPVNNGVPLNNGNNACINNNNIPFLSGLDGNTGNVIQNNGNNLINGGSGFPVFNGGQLPAGTNLQKLMFWRMTVIDDELTEGDEHGSGLIGKAQGFYVASSEDGSSRTMAFTAMFESDKYASSLSFFGVHRTAVSESRLAIVGGTGMYVNAKGFATVKTSPSANQHNTDGTETLLQIIVHLFY